MGSLNFGILRVSVATSAIVLLLAYALVGPEKQPGIAVNAGEMARNAADRTDDAEGGNVPSGNSPSDGRDKTSFAEYDIGEFSPDAKTETRALRPDLPSAEGDRLLAPVTPEAAEEALAQDIAEAMRARHGS